MKIKCDHVTNSSSTSFVFMFKGKTKEDLFNLIRKYENLFSLRVRYLPKHYTCSSEEIIKEINTAMRSWKPYCYPPKIKNLTSLKKELKRGISYEERCIKYYKSTKEENYRQQILWCKQVLKVLHRRLQRVNSSLERGLTKYLEISFGDSCGTCSGTPISTTMDYTGRRIKCDNDDMSIMTEQQR